MENNFENDSIDKNSRLKKNKSFDLLFFGLGIFCGFCIGIICSIIIFVLINTSILSPNISYQNKKISNVVDNSAKLDFSKIKFKLEAMQDIISKKFLFQADIKKMEDGIYKGYIFGLNDPYSVYYNAEEFKSLTEETNGIYQGIGAQISKDAQTGIIKIVKVFDKSPANEAGLKSEDIIYKINDIDVTGMDLDILVKKHIRGKEKTKIKMTVLREDKELDFEVERRSIEVPTVEYKILDGNVGYIVINQFDVVTAEQFINAINILNKNNISKLVIDLRNNPGGVLDSTVKILDYILPKGLVVYTADKTGKGEKYYSDDACALNIPTAIIINGNSASASEVFTGAMKDFKKAVIVGTRSFGKGIVQNLIPLSDGSALKITTQHYYTPSGFDLHGKGIEPDVEVELDKDAIIGSDNDNQLKKAIELAK